MNNHLNNPSEICDGIHLCLAWYLGSSGCTAMATSPSMVSGRVVATATSPSSVRDRTQSHSKEVHTKETCSANVQQFEVTQGWQMFTHPGLLRGTQR